MNEMFEKECKELGIPFEEFPFDFQPCHEVNFPALAEAYMWILKKRQDKMMGHGGMQLTEFDERGDIVNG
jgi:hypothetical protein